MVCVPSLVSQQVLVQPTQVDGRDPALSVTEVVPLQVAEREGLLEGGRGGGRGERGGMQGEMEEGRRGEEYGGDEGGKVGGGRGEKGGGEQWASQTCQDVGVHLMNYS